MRVQVLWLKFSHEIYSLIHRQGVAPRILNLWLSSPEMVIKHYYECVFYMKLLLYCSTAKGALATDMTMAPFMFIIVVSIDYYE